jgi:hypothetical protein
MWRQSIATPAHSYELEKNLIRLRAVALMATVVLVFSHGIVYAANTVTIESKSVPFGTSVCTLGVYITNDLPIVTVSLSLQSRSVSGGAYLGGAITSDNCRLEIVPGSRVHNSPLGPASVDWPDALVFKYVYRTPDGTCGEPAGVSLTTFRFVAPTPDTISPDGFLFVTVSTGDLNQGELPWLDNGSDPPGSPSFRLLLSLNDRVGQIAVEPACVNATVCSFYELNGEEHLATVTSGTVTHLACACDCHADPVCDGLQSDIRDVVNTINVAFRGDAALADPNPSCPHQQTDFNCSTTTDILDVVLATNVAFRSGDPATEYCNPCP